MDNQDEYDFDVTEKCCEIYKWLEERFQPMEEKTGRAWPLFFFDWHKACIVGIHEKFGVPYDFIGDFLFKEFLSEHPHLAHSSQALCELKYREDLQLQLATRERKIEKLKNRIASKSPKKKYGNKKIDRAKMEEMVKKYLGEGKEIDTKMLADIRDESGYSDTSIRAEYKKQSEARDIKNI